MAAPVKVTGKPPQTGLDEAEILTPTGNKCKFIRAAYMTGGNFPEGGSPVTGGVKSRTVSKSQGSISFDSSISV